MTKDPDNLLPKNSKHAVHWLEPQRREIACRTPVAATSVVWTVIRQAVTCRACWKLAHPPHNPFQEDRHE